MAGAAEIERNAGAMGGALPILFGLERVGFGGSGD